MTKRERNIALGVGGAIALYVLNAFVIDPTMAKVRDIKDRKALEERELTAERSLVANRQRYQDRWDEYIAKGVVVDPLLAVNQLVAHLNMWADEQNLTVGVQTANTTPQPVNRPGGKVGEKEPGFMRVGAKYSVTGGMGQLTNFLSRIQNADIPIRISELSIATKSEGMDNQELSLTVSTIIRQTEASRPVQANAQQQRPPSSNPAPTTTTTRRQGSGQ